MSSCSLLMLKIWKYDIVSISKIVTNIAHFLHGQYYDTRKFVGLLLKLYILKQQVSFYALYNLATLTLTQYTKSSNIISVVLFTNNIDCNLHTIPISTPCARTCNFGLVTNISVRWNYALSRFLTPGTKIHTNVLLKEL